MQQNKFVMNPEHHWPALVQKAYFRIKGTNVEVSKKQKDNRSTFRFFVENRLLGQQHDACYQGY